MVDKEVLCEKIRKTFPTIGECQVDLKVDYDEKADSWVVYLEKDGREVKHFLPDSDAEACMRGEKCVGLGLEIAQFRYA